MQTAWPALPYPAWRDSRETLHRWAQVIGKIQLALTPTLNHWWNVPLVVTPRGLATTTLSYGDRWLDLELDFIDDVLRIRVSDGTLLRVPLVDRPIAEFHAEVMEALHRADISVRIWPHPVEIVEDTTPFNIDTRHHVYDKTYVLAFWRILAKVTAILEKWRAGYVGKSSPPQLYWGHLDLCMSRFSGRPSGFESADRLEREGYSHELVAVGWWAGDERMEKAAFYAYAAPEPPGFSATVLSVPQAYYQSTLRGWYLDYDDVRAASDPEDMVLRFFNETYTAAATLGHWDRPALEREWKGATG